MQGPHCLRDLSQTLGMPEKHILAELPHVERSLKPLHLRISQIPPFCRSCQYAFKNRSRFSKPGKCPLCRATTIEAPFFYIEPPGREAP